MCYASGSQILTKSASSVEDGMEFQLQIFKKMEVVLVSDKWWSGSGGRGGENRDGDKRVKTIMLGAEGRGLLLRKGKKCLVLDRSFDLF